MRNFISFFSFLMITQLGLAQSQEEGSLEVFQDPKVDLLLTEHKGSEVIGYRVQIHFGNNKQEANEAKSDFLKEYEDIPAYLSWDAPYFKIRVGNFRTRLEAYKFLKEIQLEFEGAFIVGPVEMEYPALESKKE